MVSGQANWEYVLIVATGLLHDTERSAQRGHVTSRHVMSCHLPFCLGAIVFLTCTDFELFTRDCEFTSNNN